METYKKPAITNEDSARNVFPAIAGALALGVGMGLAKGRTKIDSTHTQSLTTRKDITK